MTNSYASRINNLQKELCILAQKIPHAHLDDQDFLNNIAIQYSNYLKLLQKDCLETIHDKQICKL